MARLHAARSRRRRFQGPQSGRSAHRPVKAGKPRWPLAGVLLKRRAQCSVRKPSGRCENTLGAVTNIQLHRYNVATVEQTKQSLARWAGELSTSEQAVTPYFIRLSFEEMPDSLLLRFLNEIPTSFALSTQQVDRLIASGRQLLRDNAEFQRLLARLQGQAGPARVTLPEPPR